MGEKAINCLLGKIGTLDVGDVHHAVYKVLDENENIDRKKIVAYGGSHGGFLSLQLAGQYPVSTIILLCCTLTRLIIFL